MSGATARRLALWGLLVLAIAVGAAVLNGMRSANTVPFDPDNPGDSGMQALARVLEQQLRISEQSQSELVRSSREALAQVIDTVPALISAADRDGRVIFVNAHFASFVDASPAALLKL